MHASPAFGLLLVGALIPGRVACYIVLYAVNLLARQPALHWLGDLIRNKMLQRLAQTTPLLLVQFSLPRIPEMPDEATYFLGNPALTFTVLFLILALTALLNALLNIYACTEHARTHSIKGYMQLAKIVVFVLGAIIIVLITIDRSSLLLLFGPGATSAVLLLVYKDTLMLFVASVQLTSSDMLRVSDWIEMPQVGTGGDVADITLYIVKVQNLDKIIISVPTWCLMSGSFEGWCGTRQPGGRRIEWATYVDSNQVRLLDEKEERRPSQIRLLTEYMAYKQIESRGQNAANDGVALLAASRRRLINIGAFHAYTLVYLQNHPDVRPHMIYMVRRLQSTVQGIPLEICCPTRTTTQVDYGCIQGDVFDYLLTVMPKFGLGAHQHPSGRDLRQELQDMPEGRNAEARSFEALAAPSCSDKATV